MGRIFITGDTHGGQSSRTQPKGDMAKLNSKLWPEGKTLTRDDYLIVAGDFGIPWFSSEYHKQFRKEEHWRKWLIKKPWTTLFIDGNHENHDMLAQLPQVDMFGSKVGKVCDHLYHLKRGEIYIINDKKFFTFGGAESTDKEGRSEGIDWWRQEVPSVAEMDHGLGVLERHNNEVDFIISHNCPRSVSNEFIRQHNAEGLYYVKINDPVGKYLEHIVSFVKFKKLFYGHWHEDWEYGKYRVLYQNVVEIK